MKRAITVVTWSGGEQQAKNLLRSIGYYKKYPIYVVVNDSTNADPAFIKWLMRSYKVITTPGDFYECGALHAMRTLTDIDEFILLQDSFEIHDTTIFDIMFEEFPDISVAFGHNYSHYFWKWRRSILRDLTIPVTTTKAEAIFCEIAFINEYVNYINHNLHHEGMWVLFDDFRDENPNNYWEWKFNRLNLVLVNKYLVKYKATWGSGIPIPTEDMVKGLPDTISPEVLSDLIDKATNTENEAPERGLAMGVSNG